MNHLVPPFLKSLLHVASKISADLRETPGHVGFDNLTRDSAEKCIPDSLYMLMKWIITPPEEADTDDLNNNKMDCDERHQKILHICENIVYAASNGRKNTPKVHKCWLIGSSCYYYVFQDI